MHVGWDLASPDRAPRWEQPLLPLGGAQPLEISADGSRVTVNDLNGAKVLDGATGEIVRSLPAGAALSATSPDGRVGLALDWGGKGLVGGGPVVADAAAAHPGQ